MMMNINKDEILPCPFCNGMSVMDIAFRAPGDPQKVQISCKKCGANRIDKMFLSVDKVKKIAIRRWNKRER